MRKILISFFLACVPLCAQDDSFREKFADPATRTAALSELIPGTQTAYFHTALAHQLAGREAEFLKTMREWKAATERKENSVSAEGYAVLENRQLLTDYQKNPVGTLAELIKKLGLRFDDSRPDAAAAAESLPTRVDPALISEDAFEKSAAEVFYGKSYERYKGDRRLRELEKVESFDDDKVRWFFTHLDRADLPGVVPLVNRALKLDRTLSFNEGLLGKLTSEQLQALLQLRPDLRGKESFCIAYLSKLRPGAETDFERDPLAHAAHLQRCRDFVLTLPPALNSLKAHVLYHHLRLQAEMGNFPKDDLLAYLALPRTSHVLLKIPKTATPDAADPLADFSAATSCGAITNDIDLLETLLNHFLRDSDSAADFAPFIEEKKLTPIHARARLLRGGDPAVWGKLLAPTEFKDLQDKAEIAFTVGGGAPIQLNSDSPVSFHLDLKNVPTLLMRIYEIDLPTYLAKHGSEPAPDIDLDGLVPHREQRLTYTDAPIIRHEEIFALEVGPGTYIVDFTGGQVSARALIRKGQLIAYPERTATGQSVRVFDEKSNPVPTASLTLGRENFAADASGRIVIPNAPNQPVTQGIIRAGKLATPISLASRSEELAMDARFHLDREQLLADQEAKLHLRVRLTNRGYELPLDRIKDPALVLKAELLGGVITERVIAENLALTPVMEIPFQVPADLLKLTLTLRGSVIPMTGGDPLKLTQDQVFEINGDLQNARIGTAFFTTTAEGDRLEVRGRNGEPLSSREIVLKFSRAGYGVDIPLRVRTDAAGRVDLGKLDSDITVNVSGRDIAPFIHNGAAHLSGYTGSISAPASAEIRLPLLNSAAASIRTDVSLLEVLSDEPIRDHFDKLSVEDGLLVIRGLPPGDYQLRQGDPVFDQDKSVEIRVSSGVERDGLIVSKNRVLPRFQPHTPVITSALVGGDEVEIKLSAFGPDTRVSVHGMRYWHFWDSDGYRPFSPPVSDTLVPGFVGCGYLTDRRLSDETRYILDRRAALTFPGSMLPRPGLLLNRWTEEELAQEKRSGSGGENGRSRETGIRNTLRSVETGDDGADGDAVKLGNVCDFLQFPAAVRYELKPDANGVIKLPLADFVGSQFIQIIATDAFAVDQRFLPLPWNDTPLRDRRIARPLDPQAHYLADRSAAVLQRGAEATIENLLDADWRAFTTLTEAHQFLYGMTGDDRLRDFVFLTEWPALSEEKKLALLKEHACHEFHLFLARKDTEFFEKYVKPQLAGKPEPQFMDDYLLGRDLTDYLRPYAWKRLNAAEKALLSQAVPVAHERISRELSLRWELESPTPDAETTLFTQTLRGSDLALQDSLGLAKKDLEEQDIRIGSAGPTEGLAYVSRKLERIIIPRIDFEDTTVEEAIDFLRLRAAELDMTETDPAKKGVNLVIRRPRPSTTADPADGGAGAADLPLAWSDPGVLRIKELRLKNVPLGQVLKYICDQTKLRYKVDDFAVTLVPATEAGDEIFTRSFKVPRDFARSLAGGDQQSDPLGDSSVASARMMPRMPIQELLKKNGIVFGEGSSATLSRGILLITNTPSELDKIEQLVDALDQSSPSAEEGANAAAADPFADSFADSTSVLPPLDPMNESGILPSLEAPAGFAAPPAPMALAPGNGDLGITNGLRSGDQSINRNNIDAILNNPNRRAAKLGIGPSGRTFPDHTKLWREANYYHSTKLTDESLIPLNRFWLDLAAWDGKGPFLSPHFNACHTNANESLMCLALLDLPFKADRPEVVVDGSTLRVKAREPMLLFYKDTRKTANVAPESPLLVRQTFSPQAEPFRTVNGRQVENPVSGDFRPGVAYAASLIVTNPTGIGRRIDLLAQIPAGAIPLGGKPATRSSTHELKPYGVVTQSLAFYFPAAGDFVVYPLHVSENGTVLAHTDPRTLRVSNDPAPQDTASWQVLASEGSNEEVLARLATENLDTIDLQAIRWRLKDVVFFQSASKLLRDRLHFSAAVAAYGFLHNDVSSMREYLENSQSVSQLGRWLDSPLLDIRPRVHLAWETLEFDPLVNARVHRFGDEPRMTHEAAREHYEAFLDQLGWKSTLDDTDQLNLAALLFLQDRIEEGLARFDRIDPAKLPGRMIYDYLHAVVLFHREKPAEAQAIAARIVPTLAPGLWRDRFQAVIDQAQEIAALATPGKSEKPEEQAPAPELDLALADGGKLLIKHRSLEKATLRLFSVDLEVMFSKNPFLQGEGDHGGEPAILPNGIFEVALAKDASETTVELPEGLRKGNVLVSADSGSKKLLKVLDSRAIELRHTPQERTLQVLDSGDHKPLPKTYVKVYAETNSGEVVFHKDGYTDLRGKFDYLSHTGIDPATIKRVAVLVTHPEKGARTVIYDR